MFKFNTAQAGSPALAVEPARRRMESRAVRIAIPYSVGTDSGGVNLGETGDFQGVPASSRSRIGLRQRHLQHAGERQPESGASTPHDTAR